PRHRMFLIRQKRRKVVNPRIFGIGLHGFPEVIARVLKIVLAQSGIPKSSEGGGIVWLGSKYFFEFIDGLVLVIGRVLVHIGHYGLCIRRTDRGNRITGGLDTTRSWNSHVMDSPSGHVIAQPLV